MTVHGFPGYAAGRAVPTLVQVLDGAAPANTPAIRVDIAPGKEFRYSGGGYTIVQQALIDVSGKPYPELMDETVLKPLGMTQSTYEQPLPPDRLRSARGRARRAGAPDPRKTATRIRRWRPPGLWTTASDLARFALGVERALEGKPEACCRRRLAAKMVTPVHDDYGLGLGIDTRGAASYFSHSGGRTRASAACSWRTGKGLRRRRHDQRRERRRDHARDPPRDRRRLPAGRAIRTSRSSR